MGLKNELALQAWKGRLSKKLLGTRVKAVLVETDNGLFAVDPEDQGVGRQLRRHGQYGAHELAKLLPLLEPTSRVLVVGSHIGTLAIPLSKACAGAVAIEANPDTFELLKLNVLLNQATNCKPLNLAASDNEKPLQFLLNRANSGGSKRVPLHDRYIYNYDQPRQVEVAAACLDTALVADLAAGAFDLIVMDIEGSETFALRGMPSLLARARALQIEFTPHALRDVAGVGVDAFLQPLLPHFNHLQVPSKGLNLMAADIVPCLRQMFERNEEDEALLFTKGPHAAGGPAP